MTKFSKTVIAKRQTNLSWAICSTLMCICFPIGLVALMVALKSKRAWQQDRPETAGDMADMAKTIALIGILCSVIVLCMFTALVVSGRFYRFLQYVGVMKEGTMQNLLKDQGEDQVELPEEKADYYYYYEYVEEPQTAQEKK